MLACTPPPSWIGPDWPEIGAKFARNWGEIGPDLARIAPHSAWHWPEIWPKSARNPGKYLRGSSEDSHAIPRTGHLRPDSDPFGRIRANWPGFARIGFYDLGQLGPIRPNRRNPRCDSGDLPEIRPKFAPIGFRPRFPDLGKLARNSPESAPPPQHFTL